MAQSIGRRLASDRLAFSRPAHDLRPEDDLEQCHLPGALNIPLDDLERRLEGLPADREIVAYCRGPYCVFAYEAVALLRQRGRQARRLAEGYPQWKAARHPVQVEVQEKR